MLTEDRQITNFGEHLTIDGYRGNFDKLNNKEIITDILNNLPEKLSMKRVSQPEIYQVPDNGKKDPGGYSGFVVIEESHISVHTFPARGFVSADVYTCRNGMDQDFITQYFKEKFDLQDMEVNFIKRGTRYPQENIS